MHARRRPLTEGEIAMLRPIFGDALVYERLRIASGAGRNPLARRAIRLGYPAIALKRTIFLAGAAPDDFSQAGDRLRHLFVHEAAHLWQFRVLGTGGFLLRYARDFIACRFDGPAMYRYVPGQTRFGEARLEAQAEIVADYALAHWRKDEAALDILAANMAGSRLHGF